MNIKNKKFLATLLAATTMLSAGCAKKNEETRTVPTTTPVVTEAVVEPEEVTPSVDLSILDVTNNDSIMYAAENSFNTYQEFYISHGMDVNDIVDMILTINDRYVDEEGNLIITAERASNAYTNLDTIFEDDGMIQTIDNIHAFRNGELTEDDLADVELLPNYPVVASLVDTHITGSQTTIGKINQYEGLRNDIIGNLNAFLVYNLSKFEDLRDENVDPAYVAPYNLEEINNYLFNQEIYEYNNNRDDLDNITTNGFRWILDTTDKKACDIASQTNLYVTTITDPATGIDLRVNYTDHEAHVVSDVITYQYSGIPIPETVAAEYIEIQEIMPIAKHFSDICNVESNTTTTINALAQLTNANTLSLSLNN